jgi:hypothetical protein
MKGSGENKEIMWTNRKQPHTKNQRRLGEEQERKRSAKKHGRPKGRAGHLLASLLEVPGAMREHCCMNQGY